MLDPDDIGKRPQRKCSGCPYYGPQVGYRGNLASPIVVVGESPGIQEVRARMPFVGPSGELLARACMEHGDVEPFFTNALQCNPGGATSKDKNRMVQATQCCHDRLVEEIKAYPRKVILALGNPAIQSLTGDYNLRITQIRGKRFNAPDLAEHGIVAAVHPAFMLRGGGSWRQFQLDVDFAFRLAKGEAPHAWIPPKILILEDPAELDWIAHTIRQAAQKRKTQGLPPIRIAADAETGGFNHLTDEILCYGFTYDGDTVYVVNEELSVSAGSKALLELREHVRWIWHNGKFDVKFFHHAHEYPTEHKTFLSPTPIDAHVDEDTMLQNYTLDEIRGIHDLEQVAGDWVQSPNWKAMLDAYLPKKSESYRVIPRPVLYQYMAYDIANTHRIDAILHKKIDQDKLNKRLYHEILIPASAYLARVEENGMAVDQQRVEENAARLQKPIDQYRDELNAISEACGAGTINPNSPQQLQLLLYDVLHLKSRSNFGQTRSTDVDTLDKLPQHPAVVALKKYRKAQKAKSTYVDPIPGFIAADGRIHSTFLIHGTATGRLASRQPNVQNIPRDPLLRGMFVAKPGYVLLDFDLNQAELRSLACLSGDTALCHIYETQGMSLHDEVRAEIWGHPEQYPEAHLFAQYEKYNCVTPDTMNIGYLKHEQKMRAKAVNFGIVYGRTAPSLAEEFEIPESEAQEWIDKWFNKFPGAHKFIMGCRAAPSNNRNLVTVFGRRKRCGVVSEGIHKQLQNEAANFPHQATASDITVESGIRTYEILEKEYDSKIVNTVHDSIIIEAPDDIETVRAISELMISTMEQVPIDRGLVRIPFKAEGKISLRWGEAEDGSVDAYLAGKLKFERVGW